MQKAIPYALIRGGSSKGVYLNHADLPLDTSERDRLVLAIMEGVGAGDERQIDGLGGGDSLTSKVAVVSPSSVEGVDLDYLFLQVVIGKGLVRADQNCGNLLAGVLPFALETGLLEAWEGKTKAIVRMMNSMSLCEITVETPERKVNYKGETKIDGVPGTAAPVLCTYLDISGKVCGALLPTGNPMDSIKGYSVTCVDNGMPVVVMRATDFGITGYESKAELDANTQLKAEIESVRLQAGVLMNLGDVTEKTVPKMCLIAAPIHGGVIHTRTFIPHVCHAAVGVLGAVSILTAVILPGSVGSDLMSTLPDLNAPMSVEHPSGEFTVQFTVENQNNHMNFLKAGIIRTARLISQGIVYVPELN
jgi:4-oxalomesaconate tautomerase